MKKFFNLDIVICIVLVFLILFLAPVFLGLFDFFQPVLRQFSSFHLPDIEYAGLGEKDKTNLGLYVINTNTYEKNKGEITNRELAEVLDSIFTKNPKVVAIEKVLKQSDDKEGDSLLSSVLSKHKNIIISSRLTNFNEELKRYDSVDYPDRMFIHNNEIGYNNLLMGEDKEFAIVRNFYPKTKIGLKDSIHFSLVYKIMEKYDRKYIEILDNRNNDYEILNYAGAMFPIFEYSDFFTGNDSTLSLINKIVLLGKFHIIDGARLNKLDDIYYTPMNDVWWGKSFPDMYPVIIYANAITMMLENTYYTKISDEIVLTIAVIIIYFNLLLFYYITDKNKKLYEISNLVIFVGESIFLFWATVILFHQFRVALDFTITIFGLVVLIFVFEGYNESLKPLILQLFNKLRRRN